MLKTDYKNAMWEGAKKYRITSNPDGTSEFRMLPSIPRKETDMELRL